MSRGEIAAATRLRTLVLSSLLVACALAALPAVASAATASSNGTTIVYRAAPGEANRVENEAFQNSIELSDRGAHRVKAGKGCVKRGRRKVECRAPDEVVLLDLRLGDRADRTAGDGPRTVQHGGPGRDLLRGAQETDRLFGGPGDDVLRGGSSPDQLFGGSGDDHLIGHAGRDTYSPGAGDDRINSVDFNAERIDCGPGRDRVNADRRDSVRGCKRTWRWPVYHLPIKSAIPGDAYITILRTSGRRMAYDLAVPCGEEPDEYGDEGVRVKRGGRFRVSADLGSGEIFRFSGRFRGGRVKGSVRAPGCPHFPFSIAPRR